MRDYYDRDYCDMYDYHEEPECPNCKLWIEKFEDGAAAALDIIRELSSSEEVDNNKLKIAILNLCDYFEINQEIPDLHVYKIHQLVVGI